MRQGWVFAVAETIFARTVEETGKTMVKTGKKSGVHISFHCFNIIAASCSPIL